MSSYHGMKPVTSSDKAMAKSHLERTEDVLEDEHDLNDDKISDHKKALKAAIKAGNKKSADYNRSHIKGHESDNRALDRKLDENDRSQDTLKGKTYDDVRKAKVNIMKSRTDS